MKDKLQNHLHLTAIIFQKEVFTLFSCNHCLEIGVLCIVMLNSIKNFKCVKYTCCDCSCVSLMLDSLKFTQFKTKFKLFEALNEQLSKLLVKIVWLHKILKQSETCINTKVKCLVQELTDDNNETENEAPLEFNFLLNFMSSSFFLNSELPSQTAEASSHSSWDSVWVFKLTLRYCILFTWQDSELFH